MGRLLLLLLLLLLSRASSSSIRAFVTRVLRKRKRERERERESGRRCSDLRARDITRRSTSVGCHCLCLKVWFATLSSCVATAGEGSPAPKTQFTTLVQAGHRLWSGVLASSGVCATAALDGAGSVFNPRARTYTNTQRCATGSYVDAQRSVEPSCVCQTAGQISARCH